MMVVSPRVVLALATLRPFQQLLRRGLVRRLPQQAHATFVSHQWLARSHPDPHGVQLQVLQRFLEAAERDNIRDMFSDDDWGAFKSAFSERPGARQRWNTDITDGFSRYDRDTPDHVLAADLAQSFFWVDYLSVPQDAQPEDDSQLRAINSIPYYIEQSSFFIVLCPSVHHSDTGELCDYESWLQRGWCRFEMWSNVLSRKRVVPLVLTDSCTWASGIDDIFAYYGNGRAGLVGCGEFTCCRFGHKRVDGTPIPCDHDNIMPILQRMWLLKLRDASSAQNAWMYGVLRIMETKLFARSADAPFRATWGQGAPEDATPEVVLQRIDNDFHAGFIPWGNPVINIVSELGDERILQTLVERGEDPFAVDVDGDTCLQLACVSGSIAAVEYLLALPSMTVDHVNSSDDAACTALHSAICHERIVAALLRSRAHPDSRTLSGSTPLHFAAKMGVEGAARMLLVASAPADAVDTSGRTALHLAAEGFRLLGRRAGRLRVMECLLEHGASSGIRGSDGQTASYVAYHNGFQVAGDLLYADERRRSRSVRCPGS